MIDKDIAYLSPSEVYKILKKYDLITPWDRPTWPSSKPERAKHPDEQWQVDIMYVKVKWRFFYLIIFIDKYSRYIVHHALMTSMDSNSVSLEAQRAIENLRKDSLALPVIRSDNGSAFISLDFKIVLNSNDLTQKRIHPHAPEQNGIVERANKTMREERSPLIITDYKNAQSEIFRIIQWYNRERCKRRLISPQKRRNKIPQLYLFFYSSLFTSLNVCKEFFFLSFNLYESPLMFTTVQ